MAGCEASPARPTPSQQVVRDSQAAARRLFHALAEFKSAPPLAMSTSPNVARRGLVIATLTGSAVVGSGCVGFGPASVVGSEGDLKGSPFEGWGLRSFPGKRPTQYRADRIDGRPALRADAHASVSMVRRNRASGGEAVARIRFSWRVPRLIDGADLRERHAEDSPVRVVLAFGGDRSRLPLRDRLMFELAQSVTGEAPPYATLMYVWERRARPGELIPSNSTGRIQKVVVDSGDDGLDTWRDHDRPLAEDFLRAFGEAPGPLQAVAVMTDTDNTRSWARAWYGAVELVGASGQRMHW